MDVFVCRAKGTRAVCVCHVKGKRRSVVKRKEKLVFMVIRLASVNFIICI